MKIYLMLLLLLCISNAHSQIIGSEVWDLDSPGMVTSGTSLLDRLGETLSRGDYNGDGWQDLAIGIPQYDFELFGTTVNTGKMGVNFCFKPLKQSPRTLKTQMVWRLMTFLGKVWPVVILTVMVLLTWPLGHQKKT